MPEHSQTPAEPQALSAEALDTIRVWAITEMGTERGWVGHITVDALIERVSDFIALNRERLSPSRESAGAGLDVDLLALTEALRAEGRYFGWSAADWTRHAERVAAEYRRYQPR